MFPAIPIALLEQLAPFFLPPPALSFLSHHVRPEHVVEVGGHESVVELAETHRDAAALVLDVAVEHRAALDGGAEVGGTADPGSVELRTGAPRTSEGKIKKTLDGFPKKTEADKKVKGSGCKGRAASRGRTNVGFLRNKTEKRMKNFLLHWEG